jgi:predicted ATPase
LLWSTVELKVLATSREPLHLRGEREFAVPPLALPDLAHESTLGQVTQYEAVRLFIARARDVKADFTVDNATAPAVAEICVRLDGLPLAIELAAARIKLLPPEALLRRLEQRLPLLTSSTRDVPERQRTLRAAIAWSFDLLMPEEQTLFRRLAVFAGGCTLQAAETVANPEGALDSFEVMASLVDKSLLRQSDGADGEPRFGMLETIREYSRERLLESGDEATIQEAHTAFFLALAERARPMLDGAEQDRWLTTLETEHPNLRAALGWTIAHGDASHALRLAANLSPFWEMRNHFAEGQGWLETTLAIPGEGPEATRLAACTGAGTMAWLLGDFAAAEGHHRAALELARSLGDRRAEAFALNNLGAQAQAVGTLDRASALYASSLALARQIGEPRVALYTLNNLAEIARLTGDAPRAVQHLEAALTLGRELGDPRIAYMLLINLGPVVYDADNARRAGALLREGLRKAHAAGDARIVAEALEHLARIEGALGGAMRAVRLFSAAEALREVVGAPQTPS